MTTRRWVKLWHEVLTDDDFHNLNMAQQGRYYTLLIYTSAHGQNGKLIIKPPARTLVHLLQYEDYDSLKKGVIVMGKVLKNLSINNLKNNGGLSLHFKNWHKYQVDDSRERVANYRHNVTVQDKSKIREEKEKRKIYGEYKNVLLTDGEYKRLEERFNEDGAKKWVETLSEGMAMKGYKYKSHYLAILKWSKNVDTKNLSHEEHAERLAKEM